MGGIVCLYRLHAGRFQKWTLGMQLCLDSVCVACTQGGSKSGPWECHLVFVSSAQGEVPKVDLGHVTQSSYRLRRGRFQKWTLGMLLCLGIVCLCRLHAGRFQTWTSGMQLCLGIVCLSRLHAGRFQKWTLGMQLCLGIVCLCRLHAGDTTKRYQDNVAFPRSTV